MNLKREACLIDGEWVNGKEWIAVDNPATGDIIGQVPRLGGAETEQAIASAAAAMPAWVARPARERAAVLRKFHDLMMIHQEELAKLLTA